MKVLLKETISSLGIVGSKVTVADGYARNYLFPQGKALPATTKNINLLKQEKNKFELQIAKEKNIAEQMAEKLKDIECTITSKVHEQSKLYGSVGIKEIMKALSTQDIKIDKRMLLLKEPIKNVGIFKIPVRIYTDVEPCITIKVIPE